MRKPATLFFAALALLALAEPALAGGAGGMPYSPWIQRIQLSLQGEVAIVMAIALFTVGFGMYLVQNDLAGPMLYLVRGGIIASVMLGVITLISAMGVGGAMVA